MSKSRDIQAILGIHDSVVFLKIKNGSFQHILLNCSHYAPIRAGYENEALNFYITMTPHGKFTAWILWEDGQVEKRCNMAEKTSMVDIIGGYFEASFFEMQGRHRRGGETIIQSCESLFTELHSLCDSVHSKLALLTQTIKQKSLFFLEGYDVLLYCTMTISKVKRDMDKVFVLISGGRRDLDNVEYESHYSKDIVSDDSILLLFDIIANICTETPQHMSWVMTEARTRLRNSLQSIFNESSWACLPWEHAHGTFRDFLDIDERLVVAEHESGSWVDLICNIATPPMSDKLGNAVMFRVHMEPNDMFSFEIHWENMKWEPTSDKKDVVDSNALVKQYYSNYLPNSRQKRIADHMDVNASEPMLVLQLFITCIRIEEEMAKAFTLTELAASTKNNLGRFEEKLHHLKHPAPAKGSSLTNYDIEELLLMDDKEIDIICYENKFERQPDITTRATHLKESVHSVQSNDKSTGSLTPIQYMTSFRSDMHAVFEYITDYENRKSRDLLMLLDISVKIIKSVAEDLSELASYKEIYKSWIMEESSFLINSSVQLIYRKLCDNRLDVPEPR